MPPAGRHGAVEGTSAFGMGGQPVEERRAVGQGERVASRPHGVGESSGGGDHLGPAGEGRPMPASRRRGRRGGTG